MAFALAGVAVMAGCSSKPPGPKGGNDGTSPIPPKFDDDTGGLRGQVVDTFGGTVVEGATVAILALSQVTESNNGGFYALSNLPPGAHVLTSTKIGYFPYDATINIVAGEELVKNIELVPLPDLVSKDPFFVRAQPARGMWNCAFGVPPVPPGDPCATTGSLTGGGKNSVEIPREPNDNITGYIISVHWQKTAAFSGTGYVDIKLPLYPLNGTSNEDVYQRMIANCIKCQVYEVEAKQFVRIVGENDLVVYVQNINETNPYEHLLGSNSTFERFTVNLARGTRTDDITKPDRWEPPERWGQLAVQQDFRVAVTWLYWNWKPEPEQDLWALAWG